MSTFKVHISGKDHDVTVSAIWREGVLKYVYDTRSTTEAKLNET